MAQNSESLSDAAVRMFKTLGPSGSDGHYDRESQVGICRIYERFDPPAFVAIREEAGKPILTGYSGENVFFPEDYTGDSLFPAGRILLTADQPAAFRTKGIKSFSRGVGPLLRTRWGQGSIFNYNCPEDPAGPNGRTVPGCVSVAMAQILKYHGPMNGFSLTHGWNAGRYGPLEASIGPYAWNEMEDAPVAVDRELCDLLTDLAVLLHTTFGPTGSMANSHRTLEAFRELGYTEATLHRRKDYSAEAWMDLIYANLALYQPVLVTGGGHAFVCDGYDPSGMLHFNLGGAGYGDGYYLPGSLVLGYPVNELFTDLTPVSWPEPPGSIRTRQNGLETSAHWSPPGRGENIQYRVFVDGEPAMVTTDTLYRPHSLVPGIHVIHVSAIHPDGESRWIGPVELFVRGNLLTVQDPGLYGAFLKALGYGRSDAEWQEIFEGDLGRITSLEITDPVKNLQGIEHCRELRKLTVKTDPGSGADPAPLAGLRHLQVLDWTGPISGQTEILGSIQSLSQISLTHCPLENIGFLKGPGNLLKLAYRGSPLPEVGIFRDLENLEDLDLSDTGLSDAGFVEWLPRLRNLRLAGNQLSQADFLQGLSRLNKLDLSRNALVTMVFTDGLKFLREADLSHNQLVRLSASSDLSGLEKINLSDNLLLSPGRLMIYTPILKELDLSGNRLISCRWIESCHSLAILKLADNRISDLSDFVRVTQFHRFDVLGLTGNPVSLEAFSEQMPVLQQRIPGFSGPEQYQPLSPCYPSPANGNRFTGGNLELAWSTGDTADTCLFDLYRMDNDSLVLLRSGITANRVEIEDTPGGLLLWTVAARTPTGTYFSGVYEAYPASIWEVPFFEDFESYPVFEPISGQSEYWIVNGQIPGRSTVQAVSSMAKTGSQSLELSGSAMGSLPAEHISVPALSLRFSCWIPRGRTGSFRIDNLGGMMIHMIADATGRARVYANERLAGEFVMDPDTWTDFRVSASGRNNQVFVWAGSRLVVNQPWTFPGSKVTLGSLDFNMDPPLSDQDPSARLLYVDDIRLEQSGSTGLEEGDNTGRIVQLFPNPCSNRATLRHDFQGELNLSIIDISGRTLRNEKAWVSGNTLEINLEDLNEGVYILRIQSAGETKQIRFIKNRSGY